MLLSRTILSHIAGEAAIYADTRTNIHRSVDKTRGLTVQHAKGFHKGHLNFTEAIQFGQRGMLDDHYLNRIITKRTDARARISAGILFYQK